MLGLQLATSLHWIGAQQSSEAWAGALAWISSAMTCSCALVIVIGVVGSCPLALPLLRVEHPFPLTLISEREHAAES